MANTVFNDESTGNAVLYGELPDSFHTRLKLQTATSQNGQIRIILNGQALDSEHKRELYIRNGKSYTTTPPAPNIPSESEYHPLCSVSAQLDEHASSFLGQPLTAANQFQLPKQRMDTVIMQGQAYVSKSAEMIRSVSSMVQVPINSQITGTVTDGGIGVYPFTVNDETKTLYIALWRIGMSVVIGAATMMNMMGGARQENSSWFIPYVITMVSHNPLKDDDLNVFAKFVNTMSEDPQFTRYVEQVNQANINNDMNQAGIMAQQNQAMIDSMWADHNARWERVEAFGKSLSQDLDQFRAGLAANSASMDRFHQQIHSVNSSDFSTGNSYAESLDDRIQRMRHESMMGVNTYERTDGSTYEHTNQDDRVFENNFDSLQHFGTQNYYDDYVPDNWTELNRKK